MPAARQPAKKPAAKPALKKPVAKQAAVKQVVKAAVSAPLTAPVRPVPVRAQPAPGLVFGWAPALGLWWAVMWRYFAITLVVSFLLALLLGLLGAALGLNFELDENHWSVWVFQTALGEYIGFLVLWLAVWLVVKKADFKQFSLRYTPATLNAPTTRLDAMMPLVWSLYWRLLALRLALLAVVWVLIKLGTWLVVPGVAISGNMGLLVGMAAFGAAVLLAYMLAQVALFKWLGSHSVYKRFTLETRLKN